MKISKKRKIALFLITLLCIITLISYLNFRGFHAKFYNKTGKDLDSLVIAGTLIGDLKSDNSTKSIDFKQFVFDGNIPYEIISSKIKNKKVEQLNWSDCGTNIEAQTKGSYTFDIKKALDENGNTCLYLVEHNQRIFWEK
ncbi:hypothetical protein SAMN05444671_1778 [Flavobacterium sp. CF108]|uniref:hypothetical protein n=1 Tax=unclassified Flavobacterium TaxID=196869 RepID=UPI0008CCDCE0|nr:MULTISPECIES: hypothetical protein [unclassified Flavobacterium]SEN53681.1 hypothetical protein SAMN04487978_1094 [Flavobacterium sp. fv08]SHG98915.1 hypothetical protein SAMN05444671_1778 [Flavobacterium sp. CF108]